MRSYEVDENALIIKTKIC